MTSSSVTDDASGGYPAAAQAAPAGMTPFEDGRAGLPWEIGAIVQGGKGFSDNRDDFKF